ncbi:hypothetical protein EI555_005714 [Monodon monoceros]|uniref:Peptidase M16 C-terminal domain-containing protein n=1 Tax=Monodon monoceros TaxID=40151 RepID=A0A4U1FPZ0_MONMO|nr:hypothetical protein EI555_005714 [Monodon monoceros]
MRSEQGRLRRKKEAFAVVPAAALGYAVPANGYSRVRTADMLPGTKTEHHIVGNFQKKTYSKMNNPAIKRVGNHIIKSPEDKREYRGLELANGIKVLLISDPTTDKSSAALDVHIGNKYTLETRPNQEGIDVRQELLKFHSTYYSSNLMAICVLGRESLDDLTDLVVKLFSEVENKNVPLPEFPEHPFQEEHLKYYPLEEVLTAEYLLEEFRPDLIEMVLDKLRPENVRVAIVSKSFEGKTDCTEEWYGTQYKQEAIPHEVIKKWQNADLNGKFKLPTKNEFIPTNFEILSLEKEATPYPSLIKDTAMSKLWFKQDDKFFLPKACLNFEFFSPFAYVDPLHCNMAYLYLELLKDSLNEYAYAAELAGLSYDLQNTIYGIRYIYADPLHCNMTYLFIRLLKDDLKEYTYAARLSGLSYGIASGMNAILLSVKGYNDKQPILLKKIIEKMATFEIDEKRFEIIKEAYMRSLNNFRAEQPHQHAMYYLRLLMTEVAWTKDELKEALDDVTLPRLKAFIPQLLSRLHIEALLHGNITKQAALGIMQMVEDTLIEHAHTKPLLPSQLVRYREVQLPDRGWFVYQQRNEVHNNCGIEIYYQTDMQSTSENMFLELFCQIISEPCFNTLRTKEQLGYIVFSGPRRANGIQGLRFIIQSEKPPHYLESRVEAFLITMEKSIEDMTEEAFQKHIQALAIRRLDKPKKLSAECAKYWGEIISQQYNFDRDNTEVAYLKTLTKEDIIKFYKEMLAVDAPRRHKVSVHVLAREMDSCPVVGEFPCQNDINLSQAPALPQPEVIQNMTEFKRGLPLFPLVKPHINFMAAKL